MRSNINAPMKLNISGLHQVCRGCSSALEPYTPYECLKCGGLFERKVCPEIPRCRLGLPCNHRKGCQCGSSSLQRVKRLRCSECQRGSPPRNRTCGNCGNAMRKHIFRDLQRFWSFCPTCDSDVIPLLKQSGIPPEHIKDLNEMRPNALNKKLIAFIRGTTEPSIILRSRRWLVMAGTEGIGKTEFASIFLRRQIRWMVPGQFFDFPSYMEILRPAWHDFKDEGKAGVADYRAMLKLPVLVIDNIRVQRYTDFPKTRLHEIINYRCQNNLQTIITTQYDPDGLANAFDADTVSRIMKKSGPWFCPGVVDMRGVA